MPRPSPHRAVESSEAGYSLTEIMIVVVIIGILALLALPRFMNLTTRAKTLEAQTALSYVHTLQTTYRYQHDRYAATLTELGYEANPLVTEGGSARYTIAVERADAVSYLVSATSVVDFNGNGRMNVWEVDEQGQVRERTPD